MGSPRSSATQRRIFAVALPATVLVAGLATLLLDPVFAQPTRQAASSAGLVLAGVTGMVACGYRAGQTSGRRRRSWRLFMLAAGVAILANLYGALIGLDPVESPSRVADGGILVALLLTIVGLATFPSVRRRGADQVLMTLDGLVVGGGVISIVSVVVYPRLLTPSVDATSELVAALLFPVLDLVLATVALLLVLRSVGSDRPSLLLIAAGFVTYTVSDLAFAVAVAQGDFDFGTRLDLGWIIGYLVVSLAALYPQDLEDEPDARAVLSDTRGSLLVWGVILVAGIVQVTLGSQVHGPSAFLWLGIIVAAGTRQALLAADNASLRRGLERRVREQTADLERLATAHQVLLSSVGDGVYEVDRRGRITFANPSAAEALGVPVGELLGADAHALFHGDHEEQSGDLECYVGAVLRGSAVVSGLADSYVRGADRFPVEITASPVQAVGDDEPRGVVVVFRDVTHRREVERMKDEFLSVVSHELRTPLTAIRGSLGLLAGGAVGDLGPRAASMVTVAVESSERLTRLINDLLDFERINSGERPLRLSAVDSGLLVTAAVHQIEGLAEPLGVRVEAGDCSGRVLGDEDQLMQTLTNLLGNAIKFSTPGDVVRASVVQRDREVHFDVRDEGRGIPPDQLESVFEPFAQVDSSDARDKGGTGLGLAICRSIVERHGGRIWLESELGLGTTVRFTVPAAP